MTNDVDHNLREVQKSLGNDFKLNKIDDCHYEIENGKCILKFYFERYEPSKAVILVADPAIRDDDGMKLVVLRHLFQARERLKPDESRFEFIGRTLANDLTPLLNGDFSVREAYDRVESDFLDRIDEVLSLPSSAPARRMFDQCDINWLSAFDT